MPKKTMSAQASQKIVSSALAGSRREISYTFRGSFPPQTGYGLGACVNGIDSTLSADDSRGW